MSRIPLLFFLAALELQIIGFSGNVGQPPYHVVFVLYSGFNALALYVLMFLHSRPLSDIRPWLYRRGARGWFRDDAPVIFTFVALLAVFSAGAVVLALRFRGATQINTGFASLRMILFFQIATMTVIVLRDALYFQAVRILSKNGLKFGALIYILVFTGFTGLLVVAQNGHGSIPFTDLTPVSAILSAGFADNMDRFSVLLSFYIVVNALLAIAFAGVNLRLFARARARLAKDFPNTENG